MTKKRSSTRKQKPVKRTSKRSGGVDVDAKDVKVNGDLTGRDKNVVSGDLVKGDKIIQQVAEPIATSLHQLPSPPIDFSGRAAELAELLSNIDGGAIITSLRGMGGIGKTALALVLADKLKAKYPDAQFYLDLRGASDKPMPPLEAMQHVIRGYHPTAKLPDDPNDIATLYRSVLDGQRALLLMDNAKDADQIKPLLPPASCLMLITSRQKFSVQGMRDPIDLNTLLPNDAHTLLLNIAKRIGDFADEIAKLCGYLPLALQVSASTLAERADLQPQDFIHRLSDTQHRLQLTDVEASLQLSYDLLTPELKQTFSQLSVFPASFAAVSEEAICEDTDHLRLSELVRLSLAQYDETTQRYQLHDLVRLFADKRLNNQKRATTQYRHAEHYLNVLSATQQLYMQGNDNITRGLALFDLEWINIQAGQAWAAAHAKEDNAIAKLCDGYPTAGVYTLNLRLHSFEQIRWMETALTAARELKDRSGEGKHLGNLGVAYFSLGEPRKAIDFFEQALIIDREIGDRRGEGGELGNLGNAYIDLGETRTAIKYHQQALIIDRETSNRRGEAADLANLGNAYTEMGETRTAIEFFEQALNIDRETGDRRSESITLGNLGVAYKNLGETRKAIEFYEQRLVIAHEIGDRHGEAATLVNTGNVHLILGELREAIEFHEQALPIFREIGDRRGEGNALGNLGHTYLNLGEMRKAIEFCEQQLLIAREIGDRRGEGNTQFNMGLAFDQLGEHEKAIKSAEAALKIFEQIESPHAEIVRKQLAEWRKDSDQSIS